MPKEEEVGGYREPPKENDAPSVDGTIKAVEHLDARSVAFGKLSLEDKSERDFLIFSFVAAVLLYPVAGAAAALTFFFGVVARYVK